MLRIGEYEFNKNSLLGEGGFGKVYKGNERKTSRNVAVKEISVKTQAIAEMVKKEFTILSTLASLRQENLVRMYTCYITDSCVYLVMEYCNGGDLADYLRLRRPLGERRTREFLGQLARGMRVMYDNNIVHRDLKPQNIMLDTSSSRITLKIADFGISKVLEGGMGKHTRIGTPNYMAPEVMTGKYNAKVDLWSLGIIVYECLTGQVPTTNPPTIPYGTNVELGHLLIGLLKRNPQQRMSFQEFFSHPSLS